MTAPPTRRPRASAWWARGGLLALVAVLVLLLRAWLVDEEDPTPLDEDVAAAGTPTLSGRRAAPAKAITAIPNPYRDETDVRRLLESMRVHQKFALERLAALVEEDEQVAAALVDFLREERDGEWSNEGWRLETVYTAIAAVGAPCLEPLAALYREGPRVHQRRVALAYERLGPKALPHLPDILREVRGALDASVREPLVGALGAMGPEAHEALGWLETTYRSDYLRMGMRLAILDAIHGIRGADDEMMRIWMDVLLGEGRSDKEQVIETLTEVGPEAGKLAPEVIRAFLDNEELVSSGIECLAALEPQTEDVVRVLLGQASNTENRATLRHRAVHALGPQGDAGRRALVSLLYDDDLHLRVNAALALVNTGAADREVVVEAMLDTLARWPQESINWLMLRVWHRLGVPARRALEALLRLDERLDPDERVHGGGMFPLVLLLREFDEASQQTFLAVLDEDVDYRRVLSAWNSLGHAGDGEGGHLQRLPTFLELPLLRHLPEPGAPHGFYAARLANDLRPRHPEPALAALAARLTLYDAPMPTQPGRPQRIARRLDPGATFALAILEQVGKAAKAQRSHLLRFRKEIADELPSKTGWTKGYWQDLLRRTDGVLEATN